MTTTQSAFDKDIAAKASRGFCLNDHLQALRQTGMRSRVLLPIFGALLFENIATVFRLVAPAATASALDCAISGNVGFAWLSQLFSSVGIARQDRKQAIEVLCLVALASSVASVFFSFCASWIVSCVVRNFQSCLRSRLLRHLLGMPFGDVNRLTAGSAVTIVRVDAAAVGELARKLVFTPIRSLVELAATIVLVSVVDWRLLFIALALLPLVWLTHWSWNTRVQPSQVEFYRLRAECDSRVVSALLGIRVIRVYGQEANEVGRWAKNDNAAKSLDRKIWLDLRVVASLWDLLLPILAAALLWWSGTEVIEGRLSAGDVLLFSLCLGIMVTPMHSLAESLGGVQSSLVSLQRVASVLAVSLENDEGINGDPRIQQLTDSCGLISFRNVSFRYPGGTCDALKDATLDFVPGEIVALVGPNGSGKTTMVNLIAAFYRPTSGAILIDGIELSVVDLIAFRRMLALVDQEIYLFKGTIADNIAFARPEASQAEIEAASIAAGSHEFILALAEGYATTLGEGGSRLSGGQKQRIAIARALLTRPQILILDEFSSQLDPGSERSVLEGIRQFRPSGPVFVVTHRRDVAAIVDRVVMFEAGRIVEVGKHADLLIRSDCYSQFWLDDAVPKNLQK